MSGAGATDARVAVRAAHARAIIDAAIAAADPAPAVGAALATLSIPRRTHVIAIGKAAPTMARAALARLPDSVTATIIAPRGADPGVARPGVRMLHGSHPLPDEHSARAGAAVMQECAAVRPGDMVIVLLSGGASALCIAPAEPVAWHEYAELVRSLLLAGATIQELNTVRAHIDRLKGGGLLHCIAPARAVGLVVSDVVGNDLGVIASGPLSPARSSPRDALAVLERYRLLDSAPAAVRAVLERAHRTPAAPDVDVRVILDNAAALDGATAAARRLGYDVQRLADPVTGLARDVGARFASDAIAAAARHPRSDPPLCILAGGETTVAVEGTGRGGRNQELALAAAIILDGEAGITVASAGTDGIDGPTDAAGAVADEMTVARGRDAGRSAAADLHDNDSYTFFAAAGGLIRTGPTGTNVMDVQLAIVEGRR